MDCPQDGDDSALLGTGFTQVSLLLTFCVQYQGSKVSISAFSAITEVLSDLMELRTCCEIRSWSSSVKKSSNELLTLRL